MELRHTRANVLKPTLDRTLVASHITKILNVEVLALIFFSYVYDLITDLGHFRDHIDATLSAHEEVHKQGTIPSCTKFSLSELEKASIRFQNNKFSKNHKA